jgi:hypothetical protein
MLRRVALVRTDVSEEISASFIGVTRIGELRTKLAVTSNQVFLRCVRRLLVTASDVPSSPILVTLTKEVLSSSETSVLTRATRHNIREDTILHSPFDFTYTDFLACCSVVFSCQFSVHSVWSHRRFCQWLPGSLECKAGLDATSCIRWAPKWTPPDVEPSAQSLFRQNDATTEFWTFLKTMKG